MSRLDLPDGAWCELADPVKVSHRRRKPVQRIMFELVQLRITKPDKYGTEELDLLEQFADALVLALVTGWSYDLPVTAEGLGDIPGDAYDVIQKACGALSNALLPSFEVSPDPKAPTPNSDGSPTPLQPASST
jgi:hypothetical protein